MEGSDFAHSHFTPTYHLMAPHGFLSDPPGCSSAVTPSSNFGSSATPRNLRTSAKAPTLAQVKSELSDMLAAFHFVVVHHSSAFVRVEAVHMLGSLQRTRHDLLVDLLARDLALHVLLIVTEVASLFVAREEVSESCPKIDISSWTFDR